MSLLASSLGRTVALPSGLTICRPSLRRCAARPARTRKVTSRPAWARRPPKRPPIEPAPTTSIRMGPDSSTQASHVHRSKWGRRNGVRRRTDSAGRNQSARLDSGSHLLQEVDEGTDLERQVLAADVYDIQRWFLQGIVRKDGLHHVLEYRVLEQDVRQRRKADTGGDGVGHAAH